MLDTAVTKHDQGGVTVPDTIGVDSIVCIKDPSVRSLHNKSSWFELSVFGAFLNKHCQHHQLKRISEITNVYSSWTFVGVLTANQVQKCKIFELAGFIVLFVMQQL